MGLCLKRLHYIENLSRKRLRSGAPFISINKYLSRHINRD